MGNDPKPSAYTCNIACDIAGGNSEGKPFDIADRLLFPDPSMSVSTEDLRCLDKEIEEIEELSPRGVLEDDGESETASSKTSTSEPETPINLKSDSQWHGFIRKLKKAPAKSLHPFHPSMPSLPTIKKLARKKSTNSTHSMPALPPNLDAEMYFFESSWKNFSLSEIERATNNFSPGMQIPSLHFLSFCTCIQLHLATTVTNMAFEWQT
ncbi:unnamed protein product [Ilex paraguariensis]|uniref:Uncharacterized protein n=1 Tax=Ilex paraguariensis TaxID=185542 RepID=A0ABC8SXI8_9AQUA